MATAGGGSITGRYSKKCVSARLIPDETRASGAILPSRKAPHSAHKRSWTEPDRRASLIRRCASAICIKGVGMTLVLRTGARVYLNDGQMPECCLFAQPRL